MAAKAFLRQGLASVNHDNLEALWTRVVAAGETQVRVSWQETQTGNEWTLLAALVMTRWTLGNRLADAEAARVDAFLAGHLVEMMGEGAPPTIGGTSAVGWAMAGALSLVDTAQRGPAVVAVQQAAQGQGIDPWAHLAALTHTVLKPQFFTTWASSNSASGGLKYAWAQALLLRLSEPAQGPDEAILIKALRHGALDTVWVHLAKGLGAEHQEGVPPAYAAWLHGLPAQTALEVGVASLEGVGAQRSHEHYERYRAMFAQSLAAPLARLEHPLPAKIRSGLVTLAPEYAAQLATREQALAIVAQQPTAPRRGGPRRS
jgi:hypothetical protein